VRSDASLPKDTASEAMSPEVPDSPFPPNWLCRDGAGLHYVDEGRGMPVLLLHGNPTWSFLYRGVIARLRDRFRCIAPDLPGFGYSRPPPGYGSTPQEHAGWVGTLLRELDVERFILVAQDWGGPIGLSLAVDRPQSVEGLVLANTWCWPPFLDTRAFSLLMGGPVGRWLNQKNNVFCRHVLPLGMTRRSRRNIQAQEAYRRPMSEPGARYGIPVLAEHLRCSSSWLRGIEKRLNELAHLPIHLVWGMRDPIFGRRAYIRRWLGHFPQARLDKVSGASHYLPEDAPERVARAVQSVASQGEVACSRGKGNPAASV